MGGGHMVMEFFNRGANIRIVVIWGWSYGVYCKGGGHMGGGHMVSIGPREKYKDIGKFDRSTLRRPSDVALFPPASYVDLPPLKCYSDSPARLWILTLCCASPAWSQFINNFNLLLNDLVHNASRTGFNTSSHGQYPNEIYGLLQCRGDLTRNECYNCSLEAKQSIQRYCGYHIGGKVWLDRCFLRYESRSFVSIADFQSHGNNPTNTASSSNPNAFERAVQNLMANLTVEASAPANKGFATGTTTVDSLQKIYGLMQCWRDISSDNCTACLTVALNSIDSCCSGLLGAQSLRGSCIARYETYPFFNSVGRIPSVESPTISASEDDPESLLSEEHMIFDLQALRVATGDFSSDNNLGEGGFGPVYKGRTAEGKEIAVKKLSLRSAQGKRQFLNEVELVAKIQHRNLVKLLGCCAEEAERLIVYEYLPNKSLDTLLFDSERRKQLDWKTRYNIIIGVARGLLYLHEDSQLRIIHRDIKASNILLDDKLNPKIADFGLARLFPEDKSHVISKHVAGTYGYMAPEYAMQGQLSIKVDVYSFGVLLLEIVCGRKNMDSNLSPESQNLLGWAWKLYVEGHTVDAIDEVVIETFHHNEAIRCFHVGLLCVQAVPAARPSMFTVFLMLSNEFGTLPTPTKPVLVNVTSEGSTSVSSGHQEPRYNYGLSQTSSSINDASISELQPR
eukprot:Gb_17904 [translate_table: standard]